jgi:uncharacterized protein involved in high-affinity Fe2+ transport
MKRWVAPVVTALIVGGVALILVFNLEPASNYTSGGGSSVARRNSPAKEQGASPAYQRGGFREYPIGDEVSAHGLRVAAVWLPPIHMAGMPPGAPMDLIHLEADVKGDEANRNGFAKGQIVPYLKISYRLEPATGGPAVEGTLYPMVAYDGFHYGANIAAPRPGKYKLTYIINPPSEELGRHDDPVTGVDPWWPAFQAAFEWEFEGLPRASTTKTSTRSTAFPP